MTHAESTTLDEWSSLADLLANLIAKYAATLDIDESVCSHIETTVPITSEAINCRTSRVVQLDAPYAA